MQTLIDEGKRTADPKCAEFALGTANAVFFYAGAFARPGTLFGLLFKASLETSSLLGGSATPFDSGGLLNHFQWPAKSTESPSDFFARHELPIPGHRHYLGLALDRLYKHPTDYLDPAGVVLQTDAIGLEEGDPVLRRTHEVRIQDSVTLRSPHLMAVFVPAAKAYALPEVKEFVSWCRKNGVERRYFATPRDNDFVGLRSACLDYLRKQIY